MSLPATQKPFALDQYIMHHITDSNQWQLPFLPLIHLPGFLTIQKVVLLLAAVLMVVVFCFLYRKNDRVPKGLTNLLEVFIVHIRNDLAMEFLGEKDGHRLTPLFLTFFFFILFLNILGLIPIFPTTATASVSVTGALAFLTFTLMTVGGMVRHGFLNYMKIFVLPGVPAPLLVLLTPLEILSLFIKSAALMIRLFANMFAGHIVILSILGLVVVLGVFALPAVVLAVLVSVLEVFVAFLQAYIFTFLSIIFISQIYHPSH
ncbi:MAG: F0F1 ATP synthase subunit A [Candidatus Omnitrophica bacterium]|nr:F0F1 ATP synthase subunit A [Candidatus Omnitrophota bacterium]